MRTVVYRLRLPRALYRRVRAEAAKRDTKLPELFRQIVQFGLRDLPPLPDAAQAVTETWEQLGPAPEVDYDQLSCGDVVPVM